MNRNPAFDPSRIEVMQTLTLPPESGARRSTAAAVLGLVGRVFELGLLILGAWKLLELLTR